MGPTGLSSKAPSAVSFTMETSVVSYRVVGIGEILWDVFPDGPRFGGAPANFACSVAELAPASAEVRMISAVGDDQLGCDAIQSLRQRGVHTEAVQVALHETGRVLVELDKSGVARYRFADNSAWDYLEWNEQLDSIASRCDAVCFGTLGQRGFRSRETIRRFVAATPAAALRILDVNLREPFYSDALIRESLALANVLKLNDEELLLVARWTDCGGGPIDKLRQLAGKYQLRYVALTRGAKGAVIISEDAISELPGVPVDVVDTVGAGDAFTASMTLDLLAGESLATVTSNAVAAASYVCSQPGATMSFPPSLQRRR